MRKLGFILTVLFLLSLPTANLAPLPDSLIVESAAAHIKVVDIPDRWTPPCTEGGETNDCTTYWGHSHPDWVDATKGEDHLFGRAGADKFWGLRAPDLIRAGKGADRIFGGSGHDHLYGGPGDDLIDGGSGGGNPSDVCWGGGGNDIIRNCEYGTPNGHEHNDRSSVEEISSHLFIGSYSYAGS